jgi:hypothetical protein
MFALASFANCNDNASSICYIKQTMWAHFSSQLSANMCWTCLPIRETRWLFLVSHTLHVYCNSNLSVTKAVRCLSIGCW